MKGENVFDSAGDADDRTEERKSRCLAGLKEYVSEQLKMLERLKIVESGRPPFTPQLTLERLSSDTPGEQISTLRLRWTPGNPKKQPEDAGAQHEPAPVVFFRLETGGATTGRAVQKFVELCKDPPFPDPSQTGPRNCLLYTSPSPRDATLSRMPSSA